VPGSHTGCSAPPCASTPLAAVKKIAFGWLSTQLDETLIKVPKGGVSALLITNSSLSSGRTPSHPLETRRSVFMELTGTVKLTAPLKETTRLLPSPAKMHGKKAVTPFGPDVAVLPVSP
jgi:hypothetical protein